MCNSCVAIAAKDEVDKHAASRERVDSEFGHLENASITKRSRVDAIVGEVRSQLML